LPYLGQTYPVSRVEYKRRAFLAVAALAAAGALLCCSVANASSDDPDLAAVHSFAFAIGNGTTDGDVATRYADYDLVVVDGQTPPAKVAAIGSSGAIVLGYLSVGTLEPYRSWYRKLRRFRLPDRFEEFDEDYARVNAAGFRHAITRIGRHLLQSRHFDGLFLDNADMIETHKRQRGGMFKLVRVLSRLVHHDGRYLFAQNGQGVIKPMLRFYDGWNREDVTWTFNFDKHRYQPVGTGEHARALRGLRKIGEKGLLTTSSDYTKAGNQGAIDDSVAASCGAGAVPFVSDIWLTRIPVPPLLCE
jgi:polysaccharide biosynthesis protein PelA